MGEISARLGYGFYYHDCNHDETGCTNGLDLWGHGRRAGPQWEEDDGDRWLCEAVQRLVFDNASTYIKTSTVRQGNGVTCEDPISVYVLVGSPTMSAGVIAAVPDRAAVKELRAMFPGVALDLLAAPFFGGVY